VRTCKTVHQYQVLEMCFREYRNKICKWVLYCASVKENLHCVLVVPLRPSDGTKIELQVSPNFIKSLCVLRCSANLKSITVFPFETPIGQILYTAVIAHYSKSHCEHMNTLFRQNSELFNIKPGGKQSRF
jgi:hypothetical protein